MLLDLVSPWAAAVESSDPARMAALKAEHAPLLDRLRIQRTPDQNALPLAADPRLLALVMRHATPPAARQRLAGAVERASLLGADAPFGVVLLAGDGRGEITEPLPWEAPPMVALFLEHAGAGASGARRIAAAVARGAALVTRWSARDSASELAAGTRSWNRWEIARDVPLGEWVYADGIATHLALAADPSLPVHVVLGVSRGAFARLREAERALRLLIERDLALPGLGPLLRWMVRDAAVASRTVDGVTIPPGAGHYLAWRLTEARVRSVGLRAALRAPS